MVACSSPKTAGSSAVAGRMEKLGAGLYVKQHQKNPVCKLDERLEDILEFFAGGRCMCKEKACLPEMSKLS